MARVPAPLSSRPPDPRERAASDARTASGAVPPTSDLAFTASSGSKSWSSRAVTLGRLRLWLLRRDSLQRAAAPLRFRDQAADDAVRLAEGASLRARAPQPGRRPSSPRARRPCASPRARCRGPRRRPPSGGPIMAGPARASAPTVPRNSRRLTLAVTGATLLRAGGPARGPTAQPFCIGRPRPLSAGPTPPSVHAKSVEWSAFRPSFYEASRPRNRSPPRPGVALRRG